MAQEEHGLTLCIPTYNRARLLRRTLESLSNLDIPGKHPVAVLVINNNCTDDTSEVAADNAAHAPFPVREIVEQEQGLGPARNRGLHEAGYDHVAYLDDDIEIAPTWVRGFFDAVDNYDADAVVGPVTPDFEEQPPDYATPAILDSVSSPYSRRGDRPLVLPAQDAHEMPGCNMAVKRTVALEVGGFDPSLDRNKKGLLAGGDFEFGMKLVAAGKKVVYHPLCGITHILTGEKLSKPYLRRRWAGEGRTRRVFSERHGINLSPAQTLAGRAGALRLLLRALFLRVAGRSAPAFETELKAIRAWAYWKRS